MASLTSTIRARSIPLPHGYTLLAGLLILIAGLAAIVAPTDPDVWWHLRNGRLVLESGVPSVDIYSHTAAGRHWLMQEWLTETVMYLVQSTLGYGALSLLFGGLQALGSILVYRLLRLFGAGRLLAILLLMCYFAFAAPTWGVRPQVVTPVFLGAFYLILLHFRQNTSHTRPLVYIRLLMLLWANTHASFFIGIGLIGAFLVGEIAHQRLARSPVSTSVRPLALTLGGALAASLANPYFVGLWTYPLTYVVNGTSNPLLRYTQEWQSPNFHEPGNMLFGLTLALLAVVGTRAVRRPESVPVVESRMPFDATLSILVVVFTLLALQAVRLVPLYGVMVLPVLAGGIARAVPRLSSMDEDRDVPNQTWLALPVTGGLTLALLAGAFLSPSAQTGYFPLTETRYVYPRQAADFLSTLDGRSRLFNQFLWGGYLIHRLHPQHQVFIDGRADMYREAIFEEYITAQDAAPGWRDVLAKYNVDMVVVPVRSPLAGALQQEQGWEVAYRDDVAVIFDGPDSP